MDRYMVLIEGVVAKEVSADEVIDWIWSDQNTEEHPLHVYDRFGNEVEW
jgi:hypothetical protein